MAAPQKMIRSVSAERSHHDRLHRSHRLESEVHNRLGPHLSGSRLDQEVRFAKWGGQEESGLPTKSREAEGDRQAGRHQEIETQPVRQTVTMPPVATSKPGAIGLRPASGSCWNVASPILSLAERTTPTSLASGRGSAIEIVPGGQVGPLGRERHPPGRLTQGGRGRERYAGFRVRRSVER